MEEEYHAIKKQTIKMTPIETKGFILDIGGGGEGIIGMLNGINVIAIDTRIEELEETKNDSLKIVMDATHLGFPPSSVGVVTSFFSLMYMKNDKHLRVFQEIHRVLRNNGKFYIWDVTIPPKHKDKKAFVIPLEIILPDRKVETGYGVGWENKEQDLQYFKGLASEVGFDVTEEWTEREIFCLCLMKS